MLQAALRRSGGSYIMTVPLSYIEQNHLEAGSRLGIEIVGDTLTIKPAKPTRPRRSLADYLAATPPGLCRAEGWDEMPSVGAEL